MPKIVILSLATGVIGAAAIVAHHIKFTHRLYATVNDR
jgi:hypothetical protein